MGRSSKMLKQNEENLKNDFLLRAVEENGPLKEEKAENLEGEFLMCAADEK